MSEERSIFNKDMQIIRQSQIKLAYDFLKDHGITPTVKELQKVTDVFTLCCLYSPDEDLKKRIDGLDKWIESKKNS